nr:unknown function [Klebsiella phage vB_Kpl_K32PH164C1]
MNNRPEKLQHIFNLVKSVNQKKLSELQPEEYQAVMFCCSAMPAILDGTRAKYLKDGKNTTFQPEYMFFRKNIQAVVGGDVTGFQNGKSLPHIFIDVEPRTPQFTKDWKDALDSFPSDKVPYKPNDETFAHLPYLKHPGFVASDPEAKVNLSGFIPADEDIAFPLVRTAIRIQRNKDLDAQDMAVIALVKHMDHYLQVKRIATSLCVLEAYEVISESELDGELPKGSINPSEVAHLGLSHEALFLGLLKTGRFYRIPPKSL